MSDDSEGEMIVGTNGDERLAMLSRINDLNDGIRAEELRNVNDDDTTEEFVVQATDGTQEVLTDEAVVDVEAAAEIEKLAEESSEPPPAEQMVTLKVNGREIVVPLSEAIARAQKVEAADAYLKEAARLRAEQEHKQREEAPEELVEDDLALARAIQMGSEEEAVAALRKMRQATLSKDEIAKTIDDRLTFKEAIQWFNTEYADIMADPVLNQLAKDTDAKLLAQGDRRSYQERYKDIGDTLKGWVDKTVAARIPKSTPPQGTEKLARKAAVSNVPKGASHKAASSIEEEPDESTSSVIAKIAQARGGPQWMQGVTRH